MVITLGPDLEAALNDLARKQGVAPEALAINALRERFLPAALRIQPRDEWERRLLEAATDCGVSLSDVALGREELYECGSRSCERLGLRWAKGSFRRDG